MTCVVKKLALASMCAAGIALSPAIPAAEPKVISGLNVAVGESELLNIIDAMQMAKLIPAQTLTAANVDKIAKDYYMYAELAREAQKTGFAKRADVQKFLEINQARVLGTAYLNHYVTSLDIPDLTDAAREDYLLNKKRFVQPAQINAQHILIAIDGDEPAAKQQIEKLRRDLVKAPEKFEEYAEQYSTDRSAKNNKGNLGYFTADRMVPEFSVAAFAMQKNQISQPVKTQFGWHLIKVLDSKPEKQLKFEDVKDQLIAAKKADYVNQARNSKMEGILLSPDVITNEAALEGIANKANQKLQ